MVTVEHLAPSRADLSAAAFPAPEVTLNGGLSPYQGAWGSAQAAHLLRRTTFGVTKQQLDQLVALGDAQTAVDAVLNLPSAAPAPPINNYNGPDYTDPDVLSGETFVNAQYLNPAEGYRIESWRGWWLDLMLHGEANIREKMTLFWHNLFATKTPASFWSRAIYQHNAMLRANALGNFKALTKAVTLDPHMLIFLNGVYNNVLAPDENYARELQELFTVGKDSTNTYSEEDVVAAARVLTGWRIDIANASTFFEKIAHDKNDKKFSAFYNNRVIKGGDDGEAELDELLDMIFQKSEVASFICRKIYRFFVYYKIDATVEAEVIQPLAQIFRDNQYDIRPVMAALLGSEHFFDATNKGCYIKTPLDMIIGLLRNFNVSPNSSTLYDQWQIRLYLNYTAGELQMLPGDPPNVAGWQAFRQSPGYYRTWINGDTIRNRNVFSDIMCFYYYETTNDRLSISHIAFAEQFEHPEDPVQLVDALVRILVPVDLPPLKKWFLKNILLSGQANDYYWTQLWNAYQADPTNAMTKEMVNFRLAVLHKYIMNLAEYQLG